MPDTFVKIATVTVGAGGAANITFTSIVNTYTDLVLLVSGRSTAAVTSTQIGAYINGGSYPQSASSNRSLLGSGSAASSTTNTLYLVFGDVPGTSATSTTFSNIQIYLPNYAGSANKSMSTDSVTENNATAATAGLYANLFADTTAISGINLGLGSGNFAEYSTATLYGISKS